MVSAIPNGPAPEAPLPAQRLAALRSCAAARMQMGATSELLIREQQALITALADVKFVKAMATIYANEVNKPFSEDAAHKDTKTDYRITPDQALAEVCSILHNRIHDAGEYAKLLLQPEFIAAAQAEAAQPPTAAKPYEMPSEKKQEILQSLNPDGKQPAAHVAANALGQRIVHMTLANIFRPQAGELRAPLVDALARAWPEATGGQLENLAITWLKARHDPAHAVADSLNPNNGELYKEGIKKSLESLQHRPQQIIQPVLHTAAPPAQIMVPAQQPTKLQTATSELMMDTI